MINKNSMTYWWPKLQNLDIPKPKTIIIPINLSFRNILGILDGEKESAEAWDRQVSTILGAIQKVGLPAFIRTDYLSAKHEWKDSCYVTEPDNIRRHISELVEATAMADLSLEAIVVREYIEMNTVFTAFSGDLPINPERRYFIKNGEIQCHHAYWIQQAILEGNSECVLRIDDKTGNITGKEFIPKGLPDNWKELLTKANTETDKEIELLSRYARQVIEVIPGYWSVDFCKAKDERWILIDMAEGDRSWHDEGCPLLVQ